MQYAVIYHFRSALAKNVHFSTKIARAISGLGSKIEELASAVLRLPLRGCPMCVLDNWNNYSPRRRHHFSLATVTARASCGPFFRSISFYQDWVWPHWMGCLDARFQDRIEVRVLKWKNKINQLFFWVFGATRQRMNGKWVNNRHLSYWMDYVLNQTQFSFMSRVDTKKHFCKIYRCFCGLLSSQSLMLAKTILP